ncbi:GntR family transcriptional regulator [Sporosarcina sp. Marseille-Q4063]|uniref:GntR family transcriptional regulator n=1 Tax=Sporosarcina sp. Marseille-Q4063 TaxID=2810514 RepID=UPI001BB01E63|nr:GntR family transcriptional regulator [Sporosarcina sp. Marseille-Q4063]QUW24050.1 GntR family transcriptional regulator [Sporosarcina sp. Marseille-Q4063]
MIRDRIFSGEYAGGTKLVEERLAEEIGVSRTPIREAIRRLEQEGLIKRKKVIKPSEMDFRHLFQMRMLIECHAAYMAASFMLEEDHKKLRECVEIGRNGSPDEVIEANKLFHDLIVRASNNPIMIDTVDRMQSIIFMFSTAVVMHKRPFLIDEHDQICQAIADHKPELASRLMKEHLEADLEFALHLMDS